MDYFSIGKLPKLVGIMEQCLRNGDNTASYIIKQKVVIVITQRNDWMMVVDTTKEKQGG